MTYGFTVRPSVTRNTRRRTPSERSKIAEARLAKLQLLKDKALVSDSEYEAQRQKILGSI